MARENTLASPTTGSAVFGRSNRVTPPTNAELVADFSLDEFQLEQSVSGIRAIGKKLFEKVSGVSDPFDLARLLSHPAIPAVGSTDNRFALPVRSVRVRQRENSPQQAEAVITWETPQGLGGAVDNDPNDPDAPPSIQYAVTLQQSSAPATGSDGKVIRIEHPTDAEAVAQTAEVNLTVAMETIVAQRRETLPPGIKGRKFTQTLNGDSVFGDIPRTWRCEIGGSSQDNGATWTVTYTFQRNPAGWDTVLFHRDDQGNPTEGVSLPSGRSDQTGQWLLDGVGAVGWSDPNQPSKNWRGRFTDGGLGLPEFFWDAA